MSTNRVLCKFFMHGACLKGEHCEFSHDWRDPENNICTFYQKGECSFGSRCRYEHVKPCRSETKDLVLPAPFSSSPSSPCSPSGLTTTCISNYPSSSSYQTEVNPVLRHQDQLSAQSEPFVPLARAVWTYHSGEALPGDQDTTHNYAFVSQADIPICSFAAAGTCPHIHGDLCQTCGKHCLHPYRPDEVNAHIKQCQRNQKYLEALRQSQEIECSVCMELVLSKPRTAERKFGLLSECDHPFCISCIRNWRGSSPVSGIDVNGAVRACPVCRKLSYFVIPSVIWYSSKEEKEEIVDSYKAKLSSIDCRYFDFGNGNCPFGTSCFYKHAYRDGRLEEKTLRHLGAEDGLTVIAKDIRLSDFFRGLHL